MMAKALAEGGHRAGPHHRRQGRPSVHARGQGRDQSPDRQHRRTRPRPGARQGPLHHLDAALQPLVLGPGRRPGAALGAGRASTPTCSATTGVGPEVKTKNVSALTLTMPAGPLPARRSHTRTDRSTIDGDKVEAAAAAVRPLLDGPLPQGRRQVAAGRIGRRRHAAQAARPARADRRRLHGQLPHGPADRHGAATRRSASGPPPR